MSPELTRAQKIFLHNLASSHGSLPPDQWPSALVLRRWLRNDSFKRALLEFREGLRFRSDLHLASASVRAAATLEQQLTDPAPTRDLIRTLRLVHLRERFETKPPECKPFPRPAWFATDADFEYALAQLDKAHENNRLRQLQTDHPNLPIPNFEFEIMD